MANITYFGENRLKDLLSNLSGEFDKRPEAFIVNFTVSGTTVTADKTPTEIYTAHNAGKICLGYSTLDGVKFPYYLLEADSDADQYQFIGPWFSGAANNSPTYQYLYMDTIVYTAAKGLFKVEKQIPFCEGATFTGNLVLAGDPTSALHAATKKYVDDNTLFVVTHNSTTFTEAKAAIDAGKTCIIKQGSRIGNVISQGSTSITFSLVANNSSTGFVNMYYHTLKSDNTWSAENVHLVSRAGTTMTGALKANQNGQDPTVFQLRNSKLVTADTNPTVNGEICWTYK